MDVNLFDLEPEALARLERALNHPVGSHLSEWAFTAYAVGLLTADQEREAARHLAACARCSELAEPYLDAAEQWSQSEGQAQLAALANAQATTHATMLSDVADVTRARETTSAGGVSDVPIWLTRRGWERLGEILVDWTRVLAWSVMPRRRLSVDWADLLATDTGAHAQSSAAHADVLPGLLMRLETPASSGAPPLVVNVEPFWNASQQGFNWRLSISLPADLDVSEWQGLDVALGNADVATSARLELNTRSVTFEEVPPTDGSYWIHLTWLARASNAVRRARFELPLRNQVHLDDD